MRRLSVFIEIDGKNEYVGEIAGRDFRDACFKYAQSYLENPDNLQCDSLVFCGSNDRLIAVMGYLCIQLSDREYRQSY